MQVISAKSDKTIIIAYESFKEHKLYRKRMKNTSRIPAHDEEGLASTGDYVQIVPCRPISKSKRFKLGRIINKFELEVDDQTGCDSTPLLARLRLFPHGQCAYIHHTLCHHMDNGTQSHLSALMNGRGVIHSNQGWRGRGGLSAGLSHGRR